MVDATAEIHRADVVSLGAEIVTASQAVDTDASARRLDFSLARLEEGHSTTGTIERAGKSS